jgi:hypothetical protein
MSTSDLQHMLPNCPNLERLDLYMVRLDDDLIVHQPLHWLLYLRLVDCGVTKKIELNANKITTFIFRGHLLPTVVNLGETLGLRNVCIQCFKLTLQQAVSSLPKAFHMVQRLSLCCTCVLPTVPSLQENTYWFSHLRYLQLLFCIYPEHSDAALSVAYFLETTPLLEELDIKFVSASKNGGEGPLMRLEQSQSEYKRLRSLRAREFTGEKDQLELMIHIVENAPALEILTIGPTRQHVPATRDRVMEDETRSLSDICRRAIASIGAKISAKTKFIVV